MIYKFSFSCDFSCRWVLHSRKKEIIVTKLELKTLSNPKIKQKNKRLKNIFFLQFVNFKSQILSQHEDHKIGKQFKGSDYSFSE